MLTTNSVRYKFNTFQIFSLRFFEYEFDFLLCLIVKQFTHQKKKCCLYSKTWSLLKILSLAKLAQQCHNIEYPRYETLPQFSYKVNTLKCRYCKKLFICLKIIILCLTC